MRVLLAVMLILSLGIVSSCTPSAGIVADASKLYMEDPDAATVNVMRKSQLTGGAATIEITMDAEVIAHLGSGDRIEFQVQPGEHYVAASQYDSFEIFVRFDAKPRKKYYFYYSMNMMSGERFRFEELTPEQGEKELAKNKYELLTAGK